MQAERWAEVRRLFDEALDLMPEDRDAFLARTCAEDPALLAEVRQLLRADVREGSSAIDGAPGELLAGHDLVETTIGGFRILRAIGSGGMGTVYEAEQRRPQRRVALKTLSVRFPSDRARQRFEDEAEILARLHHPAIAQVLEAGTARIGGSEVPWFALELVEGPRTIDRFAREQAMDARSIVDLFAIVCDAVHYAHERGVIHRDLKPGNVLVDEHGKPKVIDFGIARLTDRDVASRRTFTGEILGTLAYMSPERLEDAPGAAGTACDVYALGVILYELLAGRLPFRIDELPPARAVDLLRAGEAPPPSRVRAGVPQELDWIVTKAMARETSRRYSSAGELSGDLRRFLDGEPIAAGPLSATYRLRKLAWRHRVLLGVMVVTFLAVTVGLVIALVGWRRVAEAERLANKRAEVVTAINRFQGRILRGAPGSEKGKDVLLADVVDSAARELEREPIPDPIVEIGTRNSLAVAYVGLGRLNDALRHLEAARALHLAHDLDPGEGWGIPVLTNLAVCYDGLGRMEQAEAMAREALAHRLAYHGPDHEEFPINEADLAGILVKRGAFAEALQLATSAWNAFKTRYGEDDERTINGRAMVAQVLAHLGRYDEAEREYAAAHAAAEEHLHPDRPARLAVANARAAFLQGRGRLDLSVPAFAAIAEAIERVRGPTHPLTLTAYNNLAVGNALKGDHAAAEATLRKLVAARQALGIRGGFEVVVTGQNLARSIRLQGRPGEAEALARATQATAAETLPADHWLLGLVTKELGGCLCDLGRYEEAEAELLRGYAVLERARGAHDAHCQKAVGELVALYEAWRKPDAARSWRARQDPQPPAASGNHR